MAQNANLTEKNYLPFERLDVCASSIGVSHSGAEKDGEVARVLTVDELPLTLPLTDNYGQQEQEHRL